MLHSVHQNRLSTPRGHVSIVDKGERPWKLTPYGKAVDGLEAAARTHPPTRLRLRRRRLVALTFPDRTRPVRHSRAAISLGSGSRLEQPGSAGCQECTAWGNAPRRCIATFRSIVSIR